MKKRITLTLLCVAILFSSCGQINSEQSRQPYQYDYSLTDVMYNEKPDGTFAFIKDMFCLEMNGVTYAFEQSIPSEERNSCVEVTQRILEKADRKKNINIYVYSNETYPDTYIRRWEHIYL